MVSSLALYNSGMSQRQIDHQLQCNQSTVRIIIRGNPQSRLHLNHSQSGRPRAVTARNNAYLGTFVWRRFRKVNNLTTTACPADCIWLHNHSAEKCDEMWTVKPGLQTGLTWLNSPWSVLVVRQNHLICIVTWNATICSCRISHCYCLWINMISQKSKPGHSLTIVPISRETGQCICWGP